MMDIEAGMEDFFFPTSARNMVNKPDLCWVCPLNISMPSPNVDGHADFDEEPTLEEIDP